MAEEQLPTPEEREEKMKKVAEVMAQDFRNMADGIEFAVQKNRLDSIVANMALLVPRLMQRTHLVNEWLHRNKLIGWDSAEVEAAELEKVENSMEQLTGMLEELVEHIEEHVPKEEWYSLSYDLSAGAYNLTTFYNALNAWVAEQVKRQPLNLDDSPMLGKSIWRNPEDGDE